MNANTLSGTAPMATPNLEESVVTGHLSAARAERVLGEILGQLNGWPQADARQTESAPCGTVAQAHELSCRVESLANGLQELQRTLFGNKIESLEAARVQATSGRLGY